MTVDADGRDTYQDLTLSAKVTMKPVEGLSLALGGMVRAPLDPLGYKLDGDATGLENVPAITSRFQAHYGGPFAREIETTGWDWGGWFSLTYELGAVPALPPTAPEGPKVSPNIIEMGKQ